MARLFSLRLPVMEAHHSGLVAVLGWNEPVRASIEVCHARCRMLEIVSVVAGSARLRLSRFSGPTSSPGCGALCLGADLAAEGWDGLLRVA